MKFDCSLYLVADTGTTESRKLDKKVELAIKGGCTMVQLREKNGNMKEFYHDAAALRMITDTYNIQLSINDRLDVYKIQSHDTVTCFCVAEESYSSKAGIFSFVYWVITWRSGGKCLGSVQNRRCLLSTSRCV